MRVVGGDLARRRIDAPKGRDTRPTSDRVREALFQHLEAARLDNGFHQLRVLDVYAGSGALAIEALSRGAEAAVLVEADRNAVSTIRRNLEALGLVDNVTLVSAKLPAAFRRLEGPFDLIFADPPYRIEPIEAAADELRRLAVPGCLLVYEHAARTTPPAIEGWLGPDIRRYGDTAVAVYERSPPPTPD